MDSARPGMVASVGDTLTIPQLQTSMPDLPVRNDVVFARKENGSLMTCQPYVYDSSWNMNRHEQTQYGIIQQDLRVPDRLHEPELGTLPQYDWYNRVATVYEAKRTGENFLPLPGPYQLSPGEVPRGGQVVRDVTELAFSAQEIYQPKIFGQTNSVKPPGTPGLDGLVQNRPKPNLANQSKSFNIMKP